MTKAFSASFESACPARRAARAARPDLASSARVCRSSPATASSLAAFRAASVAWNMVNPKRLPHPGFPHVTFRWYISGPYSKTSLQKGHLCTAVKQPKVKRHVAQLKHRSPSIMKL